MKYKIITLIFLSFLSINKLYLYSQEIQEPSLVNIIYLEDDSIIVAWHPELPWVAYNLISCDDKCIRIVDINTGNTIVDIPAYIQAFSFAWNTDGTQIAVLSMSETIDNAFGITIWSLEVQDQAIEVAQISLYQIEWHPHTNAWATIAWHPNEPIIALHDGSGLYFIHTDSEIIELIESVGSGVATIVWSPNGQQLAFDYLDVMNYASREIIFDITIHELPDLGSGLLRPIPPWQNSQSLSWSPDGHRLAFFYTADDQRGIYVLDVISQTLQFTITSNPRERVNAIGWSPDGGMIASVGGEPFCERDCHNVIHIWDAETVELLYQVEGHTDVITTLSWSADSHMLATGSQDKTIRIWEILLYE